MLESDWEDYITCAKCGASDHDTVDYSADLRNDGDSVKWECSKCGATGLVMLSVSCAYLTRVEESA